MSLDKAEEPVFKDTLDDEHDEEQPNEVKELNETATQLMQLNKALFADWQTITIDQVKVFAKEKLNARYIWSINHAFYEKLWELQDKEKLNEASIRLNCATWFQRFSSIKELPKATKEAEVFARFMVAYTMIAKDWHPPLLMLNDTTKALDLPMFIFATISSLHDFHGHAPRDQSICAEWVASLPPVLTIPQAPHLQALPEPDVFSIPPDGMIMPAHSPAIARLQQAHSKPIAAESATHSTGITDQKAEQKATTSKAARVQDPTEQVQPAQSFNMQELWGAMQSMQDQLAKMSKTEQPYKPAITSSPKPGPSKTAGQLYSPQEEIISKSYRYFKAYKTRRKGKTFPQPGNRLFCQP